VYVLHTIALLLLPPQPPGDVNVVQKEAKNVLKSKDLTIETQHMRNVKAKVIAVITGRSGTISTSSRKCIKRDQQYALIVPLLYSTYRLLHVLVVACHHQGAYEILLSYVKYKLDGWYIIKCLVIWHVCTQAT
jgi:hypothetical protein